MAAVVKNAEKTKARKGKAIHSEAQAKDVLELPKYDPSKIPQYAPQYGGEIVMRSLNELDDNPRNPRDMSESPAAVYALALNIRTNFIKRPLVVKPDGTILKGHIRRAALEMLVEIDPHFLDATEGKVPTEVVAVESREQEDALLFDHADAEQPLQVIGMMNTLVEYFNRLPRPSEFEVMTANAQLMNLALGAPKEGEFINTETGAEMTADAKLRKLFNKRKLWLQRANHLNRLPTFVLDMWKQFEKKLHNNGFNASTGQLGKLVALFELANKLGARISKRTEIVDYPTMKDAEIGDDLAKSIRAIEKPADVAAFLARLQIPQEAKAKAAAALFREEWEGILSASPEDKPEKAKLRTPKEIADMRASLRETDNDSVEKLFAWLFCEIDDVTELRTEFAK